MKRTPKKKKLTFSVEKVRVLQPVPPKKLERVNGGWVPQPCGLTYRNGTW